MAENESIRKLSVLWPKFIEPFRSNWTPTPGDFNATVDQLFLDAIRRAVSNALQGTHHDGDAIARIVEPVRAAFASEINAQIKTPYTTRYQLWRQLTDGWRQHDRATTWDHVKTVLWRTAQAIAFAAVVLGTLYVAKLMDLSVPLARVIPAL